MLSRHEDCAAVLRDPRFGRAEGAAWDCAASARAPRSTAERPAVRSFLALNPPDHTRLRRLVSRAFTPARVRDLGPRVEAIAAELIKTASASGGPVDLIAALASPLPVTVISELLGVPAADYDRLVGWSDALARGLDPGFLISAEDRERQQLGPGRVRRLPERSDRGAPVDLPATTSCPRWRAWSTTVTCSARKS